MFYSPISSSTGSDHNMSQITPYSGGSLNLFNWFNSKQLVSYGPIPPCKAKNLLFTIDAKGNESKVYIIWSYTS